LVSSTLGVNPKNYIFGRGRATAGGNPSGKPIPAPCHDWSFIPNISYKDVYGPGMNTPDTGKGVVILFINIHYFIKRCRYETF